MDSNLFVKTYSKIVPYEYLFISVINLPESVSLIREIEANVILLDQEVGDGFIITSGLVDVYIYYKAHDIIKVCQEKLDFLYLLKDDSVNSDQQIKLSGIANIAECVLINPCELELKICVNFEGWASKLVNCTELEECYSKLICGKKFASFSEKDILVGTNPGYSKSYDISEYDNITFFINNKGNINQVFCHIEMSPNNQIWIVDSNIRNATPNGSTTLVVSTFLQYARIKFWAESPTIIDLWLQVQS